MTLKDSDILDLPDAPDFESYPPQYSVSEMIALCEQMLPHWNALRYAKAEPPFVGEGFSLVSETKDSQDPTRTS